MIVGSTLAVTEAAAFTAGWIVIDALRSDTERAGAILIAIASILALTLLIVSTPSASSEGSEIEPDEVHSILGQVVPSTREA